MAMAIIQEIKQAELLAETNIKNAGQNAKELVSQAETDVATKMRAAIEQQLFENRKELELFETMNRQKTEEKMKLNLQECQSLIETSEKKMDTAVKFVIERIVR